MSNIHDNPSRDELEAGLSLATGLSHSIRLRRYRLHVRLPIDPNQASSYDDRFILRTNVDEMPRQQVKTIKDDRVPGDEFVDIVFDGLEPDRSYTLEIDPGAEGIPYPVFENVPFSDLFES